METFSNLKNKEQYVAPEHILVIKKTGVNYEQYWSEDKKRFGPLLEATYYNEMPTSVVENGEIVDYRKIIGLK